MRAALSDAGVGIVYGNLEIAHDDDPGWIFSAYAGVPDLNAVLFHADVLHVREIVGALPGVRGLAFTLAEQGRRGDVRFHRYADVVRVLEALDCA